MYNYNGFDLFDPKLLDEARRMKVERKMTIDQLYTVFAEEFVSFIYFSQHMNMEVAYQIPSASWF